MANASEEIAREDFYVDVPRSPARRHVRVSVWRPVEDDGVWICRVDGDDIVRAPRIGVHGATSLQALCLALRLARSELLTFREYGGHLYCAEEGLEELDVEAIFGDSVG